MELNSISDYDHIGGVLEAAGVPISGTIIPREDVYVLPCALRREDFAFICEGAQERGSSFAYVDAHALNSSSPEYYASIVKSFYSTEGGLTNFVRPGYSFQRYADSNSISIPPYYPPAYLDEDDIHIPDYCPSALSGDYLRAVFYDLEQLHRTFVQPPASGYLKTNGGVEHLDTVEYYYEGEERTSGSFSYTFNCGDSSLYNETDTDAAGHFFELHGRLPSLSCRLYSFDSRYDGTTTGYRDARYEGWYDGFLCGPWVNALQRISSQQLCIVFQIGHIGPTVNETKYVFVPCTDTRRFANQYGFAEFYMTSNLATRAQWRSLVSLAYPGASFSITSATGHAYFIQSATYGLLVDNVYKSRINDLGWTWTP